jgi:hypothetical protein
MRWCGRLVVHEGLREYVPESGNGFPKESAVTEVFFRYAVHCPVCKQEWTSQGTKNEILAALDNDKPIRAYAECHDWHWELSESERKALAAKLRS